MCHLDLMLIIYPQVNHLALLRPSGTVTPSCLPPLQPVLLSDSSEDQRRMLRHSGLQQVLPHSAAWPPRGRLRPLAPEGSAVPPVLLRLPLNSAPGDEISVLSNVI